eukprot:gene12249-biopygen10303
MRGALRRLVANLEAYRAARTLVLRARHAVPNRAEHYRGLQIGSYPPPAIHRTLPPRRVRSRPRPFLPQSVLEGHADGEGSGGAAAEIDPPPASPAPNPLLAAERGRPAASKSPANFLGSSPFGRFCIANLPWGTGSEEFPPIWHPNGNPLEHLLGDFLRREFSNATRRRAPLSGDPQNHKEEVDGGRQRRGGRRIEAEAGDPTAGMHECGHAEIHTGQQLVLEPATSAASSRAARALFRDPVTARDGGVASDWAGSPPSLVTVQVSGELRRPGPGHEPEPYSGVVTVDAAAADAGVFRSVAEALRKLLGLRYGEKSGEPGRTLDIGLSVFLYRLSCPGGRIQPVSICVLNCAQWQGIQIGFTKIQGAQAAVPGVCVKRYLELPPPDRRWFPTVLFGTAASSALAGHDPVPDTSRCLSLRRRSPAARAAGEGGYVSVPSSGM